ncbi:MAG: T9SS C-terminal target domain-containing protein, partial [Bacteroidia bacterium]
MLRYTHLIIVLLFCITKSHAQSLPIASYGTWDRGGRITNFSDPNVDFVMGIEASEKWEDIEHNRGIFDFSSFQQALNKAYANNKLIRFSIDVGPDAPLWMFDNDTNPNNNPYPQVQKVTTSGGNWPFYPEYLTPTYKNYFFGLIQQFSNFLRSQPAEKFRLIAFVQVKTGCTGDEIPYKGNVDNPIYEISDNTWEDFRIEAFNQFKISFNNVIDKKIVLTFNNIDPADPNELRAWNWINTNIDPVIGFGIKGGAFNRGHHLTGEQDYKNSLYQYLVNPAGLKIFSASEMDGTWQDPLFSISTDLSFYWAALGGINVGLSTTNLNGTAMDYVTTHASTRETFRMFNRYAQQVYPATATTAFSIFHEGLNSADRVKFPESIYGNSNMDNQARYLAICNDPKYSNRGARMDDVFAATKGQVYQRASQTGLNDAGWNIAEGNIERFFTQINPDATSIGLFRVRGAITSTSSKYDRFARSFE